MTHSELAEILTDLLGDEAVNWVQDPKEDAQKHGVKLKDAFRLLETSMLIPKPKFKVGDRVYDKFNFDPYEDYDFTIKSVFYNIEEGTYYYHGAEMDYIRSEDDLELVEEHKTKGSEVKVKKELVEKEFPCMCCRKPTLGKRNRILCRYCKAEKDKLRNRNRRKKKI